MWLDDLNIQLLEAGLLMMIILCMAGIIFGKKLSATREVLSREEINRPLIIIAFSSGLLAAFFLAMGYTSLPESRFFKIMIALRSAYILAIALSCVVVAFLWRFKKNDS